jgi:hypothetical protein
MNKQVIHDRQQEILDLVREFCAKKLDDEYFELSERLVQKLGRKKSYPLASGQAQIWAAAIIHALGTINFLFDKSFDPYISIDDINTYFGTSKSTIAGKSKQIREMLKLDRWDSEFSTQRMQEGNPFANLVMVDGLIFPVDALPEEYQAMVRQAREEGKDISFKTR